MRQQPAITQRRATAGAVVGLLTGVAGPCVVRVGVRDAWGKAQMAVAPVQAPGAQARDLTRQRIGPADYCVFHLAEGQSASFSVAVDGVCDTVNHQRITESGFAYATTGARNPRVWAQILPPGAAQAPDLGMTVSVQAFAGADLATLPFAGNREIWVYPTTAENRSFICLFNQDLKLDLVDPNGLPLEQLNTGAQRYGGPLPAWSGIRIRNVSGAANAEGTVYVSRGHMRWTT